MLKQIQKTLKDILSSYKLRGFLGFLKHALSRIIAEWQVKKLSSKNHYIENSEMNDDMVKSMLTRWERSGFLLEPAQLEIYKTITKSVKKMDVCDIGCGSGLGSLILSQEAESVVSVGKIEKCTEFAQKCSPVKNIKYVNGDITMYSCCEKIFDAIIAIEVIEHISDYHNAFQKMKLILKDDGILYISFTNRNNKNLGKNQPKNKYYIREWTIKEFYNVLSLYFQNIKFFDSTLTHQQNLDSEITPIIAVCYKNKLISKEPILINHFSSKKSVKYNLNFDDLLPCYSDLTLLKKLVRLFPKIKITIFTPINSRDWGDNKNNILNSSKWCQKISLLSPKNFEIALHGYYHHLDDKIKTPEFKYLSKVEAINLILKCEEAFKNAGIKYTKGFRPPRWEMSSGTREALEELNYLYVSDSPRFYEKHRDIKIPRIFANSDIKENEKYCEVNPYKHLLLDSNKYYIHRGHLVSRCENNLTEDNFKNIVNTIKSFKNIDFKFLSEISKELNS